MKVRLLTVLDIMWVVVGPVTPEVSKAVLRFFRNRVFIFYEGKRTVNEITAKWILILSGVKSVTIFL